MFDVFVLEKNQELLKILTIFQNYIKNLTNHILNPICFHFNR